MIEQMLSTSRGDVYYQRSERIDDTRITLFFFPGLTADHTMYAKQIDYFSHKYNVITWDAPLHGKSRPYTNFDFHHTSLDIYQILKENKIKQIVCIGQSLGGYYAQAFMCRYPEMVIGLVGIGTSPFGKSYYSRMDCFWLRQVE